MHRLNEETKAALVKLKFLIFAIFITIFFQILVTYGIRHKDYGVTLGMLELMGKSFVMSIQEPLEEAEW